MYPLTSHKYKWNCAPEYQASIEDLICKQTCNRCVAKHGWNPCWKMMICISTFYPSPYTPWFRSRMYTSGAQHMDSHQHFPCVKSDFLQSKSKDSSYGNLPHRLTHGPWWPWSIQWKDPTTAERPWAPAAAAAYLWALQGGPSKRWPPWDSAQP